MNKERVAYYYDEYSNVFTEEQIEWMIEFERKTGFEVMVEPGGDFDEIVDHNLEWFTSWSEETIEKLDPWRMGLECARS